MKSPFAMPVEAMNCKTLQIIRFDSMRAAEDYGFDRAAIRKCIDGQRFTHGGFTWRLASGNPQAPGCYLVRYQWRNKMNGREFDQWIPREWDGSGWNLFSGAQVVEWRFI